MEYPIGISNIGILIKEINNWDEDDDDKRRENKGK